MYYGSSPLRYYLASTSFGPKSNFGNLLVEVKDNKQTAIVEERLNHYVREYFPSILMRSSLFKLSFLIILYTRTPPDIFNIIFIISVVLCSLFLIDEIYNLLSNY